MKNIFFTYLTGISTCMAVAGAAYTQSSTGFKKLLLPPEKIISSKEEKKEALDSFVHYDNEVNSRAVREFIKRYNDVANVKWLKYEKGFVASFSEDSVSSRVYYNKRGDLEVVIRYYFENRLSPDIRRIVRSKYYDYSIYHIAEENASGQTIYTIKINNKTSWKTIRVVNDEIEVMQEYSPIAIR